MSNDIITTKRLSSAKWTLIEKPLSQYDKIRNKMIFDLGSNITKNTCNVETNLILLGEYYYILVREKIMKCVSLKNIDTTADNYIKKLKLNSKNKLILNNSNKLINSKTETLIKQLEDNIHLKQYDDILMSNNYLEFRIIVLMKLLEYYKKSKNIEDKEEIIISCKKILYKLKQIHKNETSDINYFVKFNKIENLNITLSKLLIDDFEYKIKEITNVYNIKIYNIANKKPKLIFDTI